MTYPSEVRSGSGNRGDSALWGGLILATVVHFLVFAFAPTWTVGTEVAAPVEIEILQLDKLDIPDPPEPLTRPARPVESADVSTDITIEMPDFDEPPLAQPAPPPTVSREAPRDLWAPTEVAPRLTNEEEVNRRLQREYPPAYRDAGLGGTVVLHLHLGADGAILETQVGTSSGVGAFDAAALRVAEAFRFSPARNREQAVAVWVAIPVTFVVR